MKIHATANGIIIQNILKLQQTYKKLPREKNNRMVK